jgi:hypothetical protein
VGVGYRAAGGFTRPITLDGQPDIIDYRLDRPVVPAFLLNADSSSEEFVGALLSDRQRWTKLCCAACGDELRRRRPLSPFGTALGPAGGGAARFVFKPAALSG